MALLETRGLTASYGDFQALFGLSMEVRSGEAVAVSDLDGGEQESVAAVVGPVCRSRPCQTRSV